MEFWGNQCKAGWMRRGFCYFTKTSHGIYQTEVQFNSILPLQRRQYWMCFLEILLLRRILRGKFKIWFFLKVFSRRLDVNIVWKSHSTAKTRNNTYPCNIFACWQSLSLSNFRPAYMNMCCMEQINYMLILPFV